MLKITPSLWTITRRFVLMSRCARTTIGTISAARRARAGGRTALLFLTITAAAGNATAVTLTWTGANGSNWSTPENWTPSTAPAGGEDLIFPAGANTTSVNDLVDLAVDSIEIDGAGYTISGNRVTILRAPGLELLVAGTSVVSMDLIMNADPIQVAAGGTLIVSGVITATSLEKRDPGTLVLANANAIGDFDTQVNAGIIRATHGQALGDSGSMIVRNRTTLRIETTITSNKRFLIRGAGADNTAGVVEITAGRTTLLNDIDLQSNNPTRISVSADAEFIVANEPGHLILSTDLTAPLTMNVAGSASIDREIDGPKDEIIKTGAGTLTLTGPNEYSGITLVQEGAISINGTQPASAIVLDGGTVAGTGTVGPISVQNGGRIGPGLSPGILSSGDVAINSTVTLTVDVNGAVPGIGDDQLRVTGTVALNGAQLIVVGAVPTASTIVIVDNDGTDPVLGTFAGLPEGASIGTGTISYVGGTGNDVVLIGPAVPVTPTALAVVSVNGGLNPTAGTPFAVIAQAHDASGTENVTVDTAVTLSLNIGNGTLGGTLTGTILAGSNSVTITGVTYTKAEAGVRITATRTSGDALTAGTSSAFTVRAGTVSRYVVTAASSRALIGTVMRITIQAVDSNGNSTAGSIVTISGRNAADTADDANVQIDSNEDGVFGDTVIDLSSGTAIVDVRNSVAETFRVRDVDGQHTGVSATLTTYSLATPGQVVISEFRLRGPVGDNDEYISFFNNTNADVLVATTDGSAGWALVAADGITRFTIPNGVVLPARHSFLAVNSAGFSLAAYPAGLGAETVGAGDLQYTTDIPSAGPGSGMALFRSATSRDIADRLDAVGYGTVDPLYREGDGLPSSGAEQTADLQYAFVRTLFTGEPQDTDHNDADFTWQDTGSGLAPPSRLLGSPSPHGSTGTVRRSQIVAGLVPNVASTVRDGRAHSWNIPGGGTLVFPSGVLSVTRRFTNNTGQPVTRLRVRIVDVTTYPAAAGRAELRAIDATGAVTNTSGATVAALAPMTVELPSMLPNGGGLNTTLTLDVASLPGGVLAAGASVDVQILLGVVQSGSFRFFIMMEALP